LNSKIKAIFAVTLLISTLSVSFAAFLITTQINTIMVVKPVVSMSVFDTDGVTPLTDIDLGQFQWDMIKYFPKGESTPPTVYYFVNNTDQQSFYVSFVWSDLPTGNLGHYFYIKRGDEVTFTGLAAGEIYQLPIESQIIDPDPMTQYAQWYFAFNVVSAPFGTYHPVLTVNAYDSPSG